MDEQRRVALDAMVQWLSHPEELGKAPADIETAGEFDLYDMHYYMYRFKAETNSPYMLGVAGGYEPGSLENCGHVFSKMELYDAATAEQDAIDIVEMLRQYWVQRARELEQGQDEKDEGGEGGPFVGFVLLSAPDWDAEQFKKDLLEDWGIECEAEADSDDGQSLVFEVEESLVAVSLMPTPVPGEEAERNAANNYLWPEAVEVTETHQAHVMVAILNRGMTAIEVGLLFVKVCATCLRQPSAIGIYTSGTVFQPEFYMDMAGITTEGSLPLFNWIYFGLYRDENGMNGYTYGMNMFGKDELEVLGSEADPQQLRDFLYNIADYILSNDVTFQDGETVGYSAEQKLSVTRSKGVAVDGQSLKISF